MASGDEMKVTLVEPVCKTLIIERESNGNGQHDDEVKEENSGPSSLYLNPSDSLVYMKNGPAIGIALSPTEQVRHVYLKNMFMMPPNHEFYCPNCEVCINKVLFCTTQEFATKPAKLFEGPPILPTLVTQSTVTQSPLVTQSTVTQSPLVTQSTVTQSPPVTIPPVTELPPVTEPSPVTEPCPVTEPQDNECLVRCSTCFNVLIQKGKDFFTGLVTCAPGEVIVPMLPDPREGAESSKGWEILKSVVYGGLAELLASLSVVTSAASADASTLSIVALGIANLIGGLSVLGHNLRDLKASQPRQEGSEAHAQEDKYYELLGKRENFYLHATFAILSFLIFGLVPPIAYGFSFHESDDKDLKLAAVGVASLICITFLGFAKAYIQRSNTFMAYFKTVTFYVTSGVLASLLTYQAGALMKKLVDQLGWFEPKSNFGLPLPGMGIEKSGWGSY